ncbi:MAG: hypothetical protein U0531_21795 [Dehalococcoidia bacterium]
MASKNGCGAVMKAKRLKAVAIARGRRGIQGGRRAGVYQAADEIAYDLRTDPSTRSLYEYGTLPGVSNLSRMGALPIKNFTTNLVPEEMDMNSGRRRRSATASITAAISATPAACICRMQVIRVATSTAP